MGRKDMFLKYSRKGKVNTFQEKIIFWKEKPKNLVKASKIEFWYARVLLTCNRVNSNENWIDPTGGVENTEDCILETENQVDSNSNQANSDGNRVNPNYSNWLDSIYRRLIFDELATKLIPTIRVDSIVKNIKMNFDELKLSQLFFR